MKKQKDQTTSDWLFGALSEEIISGNLKSQEKISEPEIARRFGTSRAPVREAIRRLEERSLVVRKPRSGPRVASFSMERFLEIVEIREVLEGMACKLAAERMSDKELVHLRKILEECNQNADRRSEADDPSPERHRDFHYLIAQGSKNTALIKMLCDDYYNLIKLYRRRYIWIGTAVSHKQANKEHSLIMDALEQRDADFAELVMRRHIATARRKWKEVYNTRSHSVLDSAVKPDEPDRESA